MKKMNLMLVSLAALTLGLVSCGTDTKTNSDFSTTVKDVESEEVYENDAETKIYYAEILFINAKEDKSLSLQANCN